MTMDDILKQIGNEARSTDAGSSTKEMLEQGQDRITTGLGLASIALDVAVTSGDKDKVRKTAASLLYHLILLMELKQIEFSEIEEELRKLMTMPMAKVRR